MKDSSKIFPHGNLILEQLNLTIGISNVCLCLWHEVIYKGNLLFTIYTHSFIKFNALAYVSTKKKKYFLSGITDSNYFSLLGTMYLYSMWWEICWNFKFWTFFDQNCYVYFLFYSNLFTFRCSFTKTILSLSYNLNLW